MGAINIDVELLRGTSFSTCVPTAHTDTNLVDCDDDRSPAWGTILLVEDEKYVREITCEVLEMCGYNVLTARDGVEAIALFERHAGPVHLLVTDVVMPGMNGRELAERLTLRSPSMKSLFMSGYTDNPVVRAGLRNSETVYIQKPFTLETLVLKVRELLQDPPPAYADPA